MFIFPAADADLKMLMHIHWLYYNNLLKVNVKDTVEDEMVNPPPLPIQQKYLYFFCF